MANRRPQNNGRRMDFGRNDRPKNFGRSGVSPWQGTGPGGGIPNLLPLAGGSTEATLALASNIINLLQPRQNPVPSLLDMPIRRDFGPNMGRYDRGYGPHRMGNQGNFRRTGNYNRAGERINTNRKPFRPNDGQRHQNKSSPKKDADSKAKPVKESDQEQEDKEETGERSDANDQREAPKTRYDDVNPQLLKCHICNKSMWDGRSFENHLSGRAHAIMMQKMSESYALTADTMRQEIKIREMKRNRKSGQQPPRDFYCAMCDMYAADGAIHRTTVGHRKLKKYLHPTCMQCHKEMPTRIELDEHRLTAEHIRNMQDKQEVVTKPKPEVMVISTMSMEQSYLREDRERWRRPDRFDRYKEQEIKEEKIDEQGDVELKNVEENVEKVSEKPEQSEKVEEVEIKKEKAVDNDKTILDYKQGDDLSKVTHDMIPVYSTERGVGRSFLSEFKCVQCSLCRKLLDSGETAEVHLKTWRHHQLFIRLLSKSSQQLQEGKRQMNLEESGNWKRRKTSRDDDTDDEHEIEHQEGEGTQEEVNGDKPAKEVVSVGTEKQEASKIEAEAIHAADEDLEDWEQSVDEILNENKNTSEKATDEKKDDDEVILLEEDAEKTSQENVSTKPSSRRSRRRQ